MKLVVSLFCLALSALAATPPDVERVHCNLAALSKAERERDAKLIPVLRSALRERRELVDGYAYRFDPTVLKDVGEWVAIVFKCCQPLSYEVSIAPMPGGALWVRITGHEAKEFIDAEFAPLMAELQSRGAAR
jgi:hypothetical protein